MSVKGTIVGRVVRQFHRPTGWPGRLAGWEMALRPSNRKRNVWAVSLLDVQPRDRVLEIGFGPGIALRELGRRASSGMVFGVDHSEVMVRQATRRNAQAVRAGRMSLATGSAEELPSFDEPLDKVLAVNSIMFWPEPVERLKELRRLLRPGGVIAIVRQPRGPGSAALTAEGVGHELVDMAARAGLSQVRTQTLHLKPPVVCLLCVNAD